MILKPPTPDVGAGRSLAHGHGIRRGRYIATEAYPVLVEYCRAVVEADRIAAEVDRFNPGGRASRTA